MKKQMLTAVLFAVPFCAAAYDYDKLPTPAPAEERLITYEEAYPDLSEASHIEKEDITAKLARLEKQSKYQKQQRELKEKQQAANETDTPTAAPQQPSNEYPREVWSADPETGVHDWVAAPAKKKTEEEYPSNEYPREVWSADPETGVHDWVAAPARKKAESKEPSEPNSQNENLKAMPAASEEFPEN